MNRLTVIGGGLAGSEAAWQAAEAGCDVILFEMRPHHLTGAHRSDRLAELVCSNSFGSQLPDRASGLLQEELRTLGSLLMRCAAQCHVPAGSALAVDRDRFAAAVTTALESHPRIEIRREEVKAIPSGPTIIAAGPLVSEALAEQVAQQTGEAHLYFYDAIAPVVYAETINFEIAFRAARYGRGETAEGDYVNCPLNRDEYQRFIEALVTAERIPLRPFEVEIEKGVRTSHVFFEGCLPIEILAQRHPNAPAFGPMRPVGLRDPRTNRRPFAVVQLRQEDAAGRLFNLVGFQTNLREAEQRRVFRLIPGLECAEFARYGRMHRNTYINAPRCLYPTLQWRQREDVWFAGQLAGTEGYAGAVATGWLAGVNAARALRGLPQVVPPAETMIGALCRAISAGPEKGFQPIKANFGILPLPEVAVPPGREQRAAVLVQRARQALSAWIEAIRSDNSAPL